MTESEDLAVTVNRIRRSLQRADHGFALFFVLVNLVSTRKEVVRLLKAGLTRPVRELCISRDRLDQTTLDTWLREELEEVAPDAVVFLYDLQEILPTDKQGLIQALQRLNWRRSALAAIDRPLVIFLPRYALDRMAEYAPDLYDWYSNVYEFAAPGRDVDQARQGVLNEFSGNEVHAAERLSREEKEEWLHTLTALLAEQPERNDHQAKLLDDLGRLYQAMGRLDDGLEVYEQSLKICRETGNKFGQGAILNNISQIYDARGDYTTALSYLEDSLEIRKEIGDKTGQGITLNNIATIYNAQGDYTTALSYLKDSLKIQQEIEDKFGEGATLNNIATNYSAQGDYTTAHTYLKDSLEISQKIGNKSGEGACLDNISQIYSARGDFNTAFSYLKDSLKIRQEIGDRSGEGTTLNNISQIYSARGDFDMALFYLKKSLKIQQKIGNKSGEGATLNNIATNYYAQGDFAAALSYLKDSLKISQEIGNPAGLCATLFNNGQIHAQNKEIEEAMQAWIAVYHLAKKSNLAQALQGLEQLAPLLGMENGLDSWQELADRMTTEP
jgi:tetratricopeptide (TPR) repeat protein